MVMTEKRLFTVDEYHRLFEVGILSEQDRVELIDGEIIRMPPIGPWHEDRTDDIDEIFKGRILSRARVSVQTSMLLSDLSEPVPDVLILPPGYRRLVSGPVRPPTAWLVVEVADSSVNVDLGTKARLYAREGVLEYWVVNRDEDTLVIHRAPSDVDYGDVVRLRRGERIRPLRIPDIEFTVEELLGPPAS